MTDSTEKMLKIMSNKKILPSPMRLEKKPDAAELVLTHQPGMAAILEKCFVPDGSEPNPQQS